MRQQRWSLPVAAVIVATIGLGLIAVAVHEDSSGRVLAGSASTPTSTSQPGTTSAPAGPTPGDTSTSTPAPGPNPTATTGRSGTTTAAGSTSTTRAASDSAGPAPTRPGTYAYNQTGSALVTRGSVPVSSTPTPVHGTLVVSQTAAGAESWVRSGGTTETMLFNGSGVFLQTFAQTSLGASLTCRFVSPVPWPPWPLAVGGRFGGHATCSGDASGTLDVTTGHVDGAQTVPLGSGTVATFVVHTVLVAAGSGFSITVDELDWYAPSLRLNVLTTAKTRGTATLGLDTYHLSSDEGFTLASATPT